jgi:uncharacterized membrane protein YuzA (DUF378 family)
MIMKTFDVVTGILLVIGGFNWGLIGFFNFNLIAAIFGEGSALSHVIYALVGLSALYEIGCFTFGLKSTRERWCHTMAKAKP